MHCIGAHDLRSAGSHATHTVRDNSTAWAFSFVIVMVRNTITLRGRLSLLFDVCKLVVFYTQRSMI